MKKTPWMVYFVMIVAKNTIVEVDSILTPNLFGILSKIWILWSLFQKGIGIPGTKSPGTPDSRARPLKPDIVFRYQSIIVVLEADEDDGHSGTSRGSDISKYGEPWKNSRDLIAELGKMHFTSTIQSASQEVIRCNSDHTSLRLVDTGLHQRAQMVIQKIINVAASTDLWPVNCFRLALVDMPPSRIQPGTPPTHGSDDVFISWTHIQQTINPTPPEILREITRQETEARKQRRAARLSLD